MCYNSLSAIPFFFTIEVLCGGLQGRASQRYQDENALLNGKGNAWLHKCYAYIHKVKGNTCL